MKISVGVQVTEKGTGSPKWSLEGDLDGKITLEDFLAFTKRSLITITDQVVREEQARGFDKNPLFIVDGRQNKKVIDVNPLGRIDVVARANIDEMLLWTFEGLVERSPVLEGIYSISHVVYYNNNAVASDLSSLRSWLASKPDFKPTDKIIIVNVQPYARRLESLGVTKSRQQSRTVKSRDKKKAARGIRTIVPNGTYFLTYRSVRYKYKNNANIRFTLISGATLGLAPVFKSARNVKKGRPGRAYLYPAIVISLNSTGTTIGG